MPADPRAQALTDSEQLLSAYFRSSTVGLAIVDPELRFLAVNNTLAEINGVSASDHLGKTLRKFWAPSPM